MRPRAVVVLGSAILAIAGVVAIAILAIVVTTVYVRLTTPARSDAGRPRSTTDPADRASTRGGRTR